MTPPIPYGTQSAPDPTAVMGRRTLAWIADLVLFLAVVAVGFASMGEYVDVPPGIDDPCQQLRDQADARGDDIGACLDFRDMGIEEAEDRVYLLDTGESGAQTLLSVVWFAFFVLLQGLTGGSPGKLLFGLRVVDQHGNRCGLGKSLGRTLMWIVDAAPWLVPLVGPITAFTSTGHRRVGDLAAGTYVITSSAVGSPVMPSTAEPPAGQPAWGAPPPGWGHGPPSPPPASTPSPEPAPAPTPAAAAPPPEPDLRFPSLDVPDVQEPVDEAPPTVAADEDWSRPPEMEPPAAPDWDAPVLPDVEDPQADWEPPTDAGVDAPDLSPPEAADPAPPVEPAPFAAPGASGPPSAPPVAEPAAPRYELPPPQWDPARGTYLQWEPNQQLWLEWDAVNQRWKPIDT